MPRGKSWNEIEKAEMKVLLRRARRDNVPLCNVATEKYSVQALLKLNRSEHIARNSIQRSNLSKKRAKRAMDKGVSKIDIAKQLRLSYKQTDHLLNETPGKNKKWSPTRKIKILNIIKKYNENTGLNGFKFVATRLGIHYSRLYNWNQKFKIIQTNENMGPRVIYTMEHYETIVLPALQRNNFSADATYIETGISVNTILRLRREAAMNTK